jgi:AraC-like DNA-binding protein
MLCWIQGIIYLILGSAMRSSKTGTSYSGVHLRVFKTDLLTIDRDWNTADVQSRFWRLYLNGSEGACLVLGTEEFLLEAGKLYLVPAMVRFTCKATTTIEHFYVHFDVLGLPLAAMRFLWNKPLQVPNSPLIRSFLNPILSGLRGKNLTAKPEGLLMECRIKSAIYASMASCLDAIPHEERRRAEYITMETEVLSPALELVHSQFGAELTVKSLAAACKLTPDSFARRFRESMGASPTEYLLEYRTTQAAQLLLFTKQSIDQISEGTGFGNRFYFSRQFTKRIGVSPAAFRRIGQSRT